MGSLLKPAEPKRRKLGENPRGDAFADLRFEQTRDDDLMAELEETDDDEVKGEIIQNSLIAFADYMKSRIPFHNRIPLARFLVTTGASSTWDKDK